MYFNGECAISWADVLLFSLLYSSKYNQKKILNYSNESLEKKVLLPGLFVFWVKFYHSLVCKETIFATLSHSIFVLGYLIIFMIQQNKETLNHLQLESIETSNVHQVMMFIQN